MKTGDCIGMWTVVEDQLRVQAGSTRRVRVRCQCGSTRDVNAESFAEGVTPGCRKCSVRGKADVIVVGFQFGKWKVIDPEPKPSAGNDSKLRVLCECECGSRAMLDLHRVSRKTKGGCHRCAKVKEISPGERFGSLTVTSPLCCIKTRKSMGLVTCDCGVIEVAYAAQMRQGVKRHCARCELAGLKKDPLAVAMRAYLTTVKRNASKREIPFGLTLDEALAVWHRQGGKCALSGLDITIGARASKTKKNRGKTASLDRIDSEKGYTFDNVQWLLTEVNLMKHTLPIAELLHLCKKVVEHAEAQPPREEGGRTDPY